VLRIEGVSKRFGSLLANDAISLTLARGEVLALLGENGAGKSTLVSMLFGQHAPDRGTITVFGRALAPGDTRAALAAGIGMVHQHFTLADNLSVLDNVLVGQEPLWRLRSGRAAMRERLLAAARDFGLAVAPDARVGDLSIGERQRVEILKSVVRGARILILDEPTAVLTPQESETLFDTLKRFVAAGLSMIFISHKLEEVLRVSDRVAVLRAGRLVGLHRASEIGAGPLAELMVGRSFELPTRDDRLATPAGEAAVCAGDGASRFAADPAPRLVVQGVSLIDAGRRVLDQVSLQVRGGEIVAIAGVAGNGQQPLAELLSGQRAPAAGSVRVAGRPIAATPRAWIDAGVARIPEDRLGTGVIADATLIENALIERQRSAGARRLPGLLSRLGSPLSLIDHRRMRAHARTIVEQYDVRGGGLERPIRMLSGGNIQKFILGRALLEQPGLIIANQPTWGLDVGAVAWIHRQLLLARERGAAILLISEDLSEIFALADRVAVICHGRLSTARPADEWTAETIGLAMTGQVPAAPDAAVQRLAHRPQP
jgi:ABC-type uncharacterized transport system ATPase subunit